MNSNRRYVENKTHKFLQANKGNLVLSAITLLCSLFLLELYLRYFTHTLPYALGNYIGTGYQTKVFGIYRYHPEMKMELMRPNYERKMFFNKYYWHHKTDSMGFRNPVDRSSADVVLLGDSMIYGHGIDETSTVRHYLEELLQRPVANLAMQGGFIHEEYQILTHFGIQLHPKYVFLFFLSNDLTDILDNLTTEEIQRFLALPLDDHSTPYFEIQPVQKHWLDSVKFYLGGFYVLKTYGFFRESLKRSLFGDNRAIETSRGVPVSALTIPGNIHVLDDSWLSLPLFRENPRLLPALQFHLYGLLKIQNMADSNQFTFVHVLLYTGQIEAEPIYEQVFRSFCEKHNILFFSLREGFERAIQQGQEVFLKVDGHFSDRGARLVAELIYRKFFESS